MHEKDREKHENLFFSSIITLCKIQFVSLVKGYDSGVFAVNRVASSVRMCVCACVYDPQGSPSRLFTCK